MTTRSVLGHVVMDIHVPDDYQVSTRSRGHGHT